jgi:hypothetical protein
MGAVTTTPERHPLDEEIEAIYEADPDLAADPDEMEQQLQRGDLPYAEDDEALHILGLPAQDR